MWPAWRDRGAFRRGSPERAPSRAPAWSSATRWPTGAAAARVHRCSKTSTRPFFRLLSPAFPGRVRFHDFCRWMFQRALPWTARTSRTSGIRGRDGCRVDRSLPFDRRRPPRVLRVRGRGSPSLGAPSRDCSRERLRPNPDRLRHLVSRALSATLSGVDEGGRTKPPAPRTLARHERREGRATPDLREEIRRSPTRGAFRRKAVRKRGRTPSIGVSRIDRSNQRLFHRREAARGTLARGP
jgi:hypothetical protein